MLKKTLNIRILTFVALFAVQNVCIANVAILKSNYTDQYYQKFNLDSYQSSFDKFLQSFSEVGTDYDLFDETTIQTLKYDKDHVLIIPFVANLPQETITSIKNYVNTGGKVVITTSVKIQDFSTIQPLAEIIGVKITQTDKISNIKYVNWIEQNFKLNNAFSSGSTISKIEPQKGTDILAVWDEIEKNEPAVTINPNGVYLNWLWGLEGDKDFNIKTLQVCLNKLDPAISAAEENQNNYDDFLKQVQKIKIERKSCEKFYDILKLNNSNNATQSVQEYLALSELCEVSSKDSFLNQDYDKAYKSVEKAHKYNLEAYKLSTSSEPVEGRGIWFDRGTIVSVKNQDQMSRIFDNIQKSGINTVYFETVNAGYAIYPSKIAEQNPLVKGIDPLKWAVEEAKRRNIQLQAWMWVFAVGNDRHNTLINLPDAYQGPVLLKHPDWALIGEKGNLRPNNQHEYWLDPSDKNVKNYLISIAEEIVKNYDVDGIHLDYIRYPFQSDNNLMSFNKESLDKFEKETGYRITELSPSELSLWNSWKENNINNFVKDISIGLRKIKPDIVISAAVFGKSTYDRKNTIQQNWETWVANGWIDMLNPMIYALNKDSLNTNLACFNEQVNRNVLIYPGIALKHLDEAEITEQMNIIKNYGLLGNTIFAVAYLNDEKSDFLKNGPYKSNNALSPSKNNLSNAAVLLHSYSSFLQNFVSNSGDIYQNEQNNFISLINESNNLANQLNSTVANPKTIRFNLATFKTLSQNTLNTEFRNSPNRARALNSLINRAETLVNLELRK
jgi:uncharacterized lipoprotein YddW (UPF0748 family)